MEYGDNTLKPWMKTRRRVCLRGIFTVGRLLRKERKKEEGT